MNQSNSDIKWIWQMTDDMFIKMKMKMIKWRVSFITKALDGIIPFNTFKHNPTDQHNHHTNTIPIELQLNFLTIKFFFPNNNVYFRYGKAKMEIKLKELFGHNMQETGREGGEINFTQFTESFEKSQLNLVRFFSIDSVFTNKIFFIRNKNLDIMPLTLHLLSF